MNISGGTTYTLATNKQFQFDVNGSCKTASCIYLISWKKQNCQKYYVGKTTTPRNKRPSGHRSNIRNKTEGAAMLNHFTKHHNICDMQIQPIEIIHDKSQLDTRDKFWFRELNSAYPYGLNNRLDIDGFHDVFKLINTNTYSKAFYTTVNLKTNNRVKSKTSNVVHDHDHINVQFNPESFVKTLLEINVPNFVHYCRHQIMKLKNTKIRDLLLFLKSDNNIHSHISSEHNEDTLLFLRDLCIYKLNLG